jgi:cytochrome c peroxidase
MRGPFIIARSFPNARFRQGSSALVSGNNLILPLGPGPGSLLIFLPDIKIRVTRSLTRWACVLALAGLQQSAARSQAIEQSVEPDSVSLAEPITPIPVPPALDPQKVRLGERLFRDPRLSRDNSRSCVSCHDLSGNGASRKSLDQTIDGSPNSLNTPTVFNAPLSFRLGWEGRYRSLDRQTAALLEAPHAMASTLVESARKLNADTDMRGQFVAAYNRPPDAASIVDALATFEQTLLTPDSRFDRWLRGDATALSSIELSGYRLFKSLGCVSCHQGVNVGGNLFQRHGIFHPLASPRPEILRVPSLRNVATTAPYFHDGSAPTLDDAVRKMGLAQLNARLTDQQIKELVAYLGTLTGNFRGKPVGAAP